jgi:hypothetical protein
MRLDNRSEGARRVAPGNGREVSKRNHDLLSITRLVTLFDAYDSEKEAVESFRTHVTGPAVAAITE